VTLDSKQFSEIADPIGTFERLFEYALRALVPDLADAPWFLREREVINRLVFQHLVPRFRDEGLDIAQIAIEVALLKGKEAPGEKLTSGGDLVVWPHSKATNWRRCRPLARIEWKNISCREKRPQGLRRDNQEDIEFLLQNLDLATLNYAVLTERRGGEFRLSCHKIMPGGAVEFASLAHPATGDETELQKLSYFDLTSPERPCPHCLTMDCGASLTKTTSR
jgi:hypothetical protein